MKLGVHLVKFALPGGRASVGPTLSAVGRAADEAGLAKLSLMDHYLQLSIIGAARESMAASTDLQDTENEQKNGANSGKMGVGAR